MRPMAVLGASVRATCQGIAAEIVGKSVKEILRCRYRRYRMELRTDRPRLVCRLLAIPATLVGVVKNAFLRPERQSG